MTDVSRFPRIKVGHICRNGMGETITRDFLSPTGVGLPVYSASEQEGEFGWLKNPRTVLTEGDLVVGARGSIGFCRFIDRPSTSTQTTIWVKPNRKRILPRFLYWVFTGLRAELFPFDKTAIPMLTVDDLRSGKIPFPPFHKQRAIAAFLDRETAKIDVLIAKQERLIERIEEHGSAVVNHALTCGLNASAPMKSARVDGNPQVPAHWPVLPLKYWVTFLNNRRIPLSGEERASMFNKTYDYYGASGKIDLVEGFIFDEKTVLIAEDGANLYSRSTPLAFIADGKYWVNNHAHILSPKDGLFDLWVEILNRIDYTPYITGSAQPKLTIERLANIPFAAPVGEEAVALERFVRAENVRTRPLMKQVRGMTERLIERRFALITAAVTGQIEVAANIGTEAVA